MKITMKTMTKRLLAILMALMCLLSVPALAQVTVADEPVDEDVEILDPLTPDGNLTLVDDITVKSNANKEFITVVSKSGNYFYIIIDRDDKGENTVHFLNKVDERDLFTLLNSEEQQEYTEANTTPDPTPVPTPAPTPIPVVVNPDPQKSEGITLDRDTLMLIAAGAAGLIFIGIAVFKLVGKKKESQRKVDPDADFGDDYILDDDEESDEE